MKERLSLRWKLILFSGSLAVGLALAFGTLLHLRSQRQLLEQLEKTLETKCDEVITVIESTGEHPALEGFLRIETEYRFTPYTYFYQISDSQGQPLVRSANLGSSELPIAPTFLNGDIARRVQLETVSSPISPKRVHIRLRTERVEVAIAGDAPAIRLIQTAVSLGPLEAAVLTNLRGVVLIAAVGLTAIFFLLWYVTTRALRPVSALTRKASQISASNLRERLPVAGSGDELDELAIVLNDMLDRLGVSLGQMEHFSADAAHQLRTPLTRIRGEIDLILRSDIGSTLREQLERTQEQLERLSRLCARLLLLGRLDHQTANPSFLSELIDIDEVISELMEQIAPLAMERRIELRRRGRSIARIRGSRPLLVEALLNLLDNAIRYTPAGGSVTVAVEATDGMVVLSFEDTGSGVPLEERERIFQPFYRVHRAAEAMDDGSGLGLAIVRAIAQAHRGRVELVASTAPGSHFQLVLPLARAP